MHVLPNLRITYTIPCLIPGVMQVCGAPLGHAPQWALGEQGSLHALYGAGSGACSLVCGLHAPPAHDSE